MHKDSSPSTPKFVFADSGVKVVPPASQIVDAFTTGGLEKLLGILPDSSQAEVFEILQAALQRQKTMSAVTATPMAPPAPVSQPAAPKASPTVPAPAASPAAAGPDAAPVENPAGPVAAPQASATPAPAPTKPDATPAAQEIKDPAHDAAKRVAKANNSVNSRSFKDNVVDFLKLFFDKEANSIKDMAELFEVHATTIYRWCTACIERCGFESERKLEEVNTDLLLRKMREAGGVDKFIECHATRLGLPPPPAAAPVPNAKPSPALAASPAPAENPPANSIIPAAVAPVQPPVEKTATAAQAWTVKTHHSFARKGLNHLSADNVEKTLGIPTLFLCYLANRAWRRHEIAAIWNIRPQVVDDCFTYLAERLEIKRRDDDSIHQRAYVMSQLIERHYLSADAYRRAPRNYQVACRIVNQRDLPAIPSFSQLRASLKELDAPLNGKGILAAVTEVAHSLGGCVVSKLEEPRG
jgi:hypothetical protein